MKVICGDGHVTVSVSHVAQDYLAPLFQFVLTRRLFIAALSVNAKYWKQPKCLYVREWLKISRHIHTMEIYAHQSKRKKT